MPLLMKPRNGESWTPEERAELLAHMRCLAHLSPYLAQSGAGVRYTFEAVNTLVVAQR